MTYTLVGRCASSGAIGIAIATYSLGVDGLAPVVVSGIGAVASQPLSIPP